MISDRSTSRFFATLLSIPPILVVAALVDKLLPPPPMVPSVVAANDRRIDAAHARSRASHREKWSAAGRPIAFHESGDAP